ncbi:DUF2330 domain-containing protein [Desulfococcaceae bacterium HSG8]|nr:DUF2330 domain-containing protein [Desulfococcaceae bacterium HSG8]
MSDGQNQKFVRRLFHCFMLAALVHVIITGQVLADGCFVWDRGADLNEPSQKAIIRWDGTREVLLLQVRYEGPAEDFAWIVPLPSKPEVTAVDADKSPFAEISRYTQERVRWGRAFRESGRDSERTEVTVLDRKVAGVYDIAVLSSGDAGALSGWLNKNGFAFPASRADVLEHYTKKKWVYAAMRIDRKSLGKDEISKLRTGELQPIRFSFPATEMVYPLRISSVNAGKTEILLYVLADAPMVVKNDHKKEGFSIDHNLVELREFQDHEYGTYRKIMKGELPLTRKALGIPADTRLSLCKYKDEYDAREMTDDLVFEHFEPLPYLIKRANMHRFYREILAGIYGEILVKNAVKYLIMLAKDEDPDVRSFLACNPNTPADILIMLAEDEYWYVRTCLAGNPNSPADILKKLTNDHVPYVRKSVADNPNTSADILIMLARDENSEVRRSVAGNPNSPPDILIMLAKDEYSYVRFFVAGNPNTPADILIMLAKDENSDVRISVACNPNTPADILIMLPKDENSDVRISVADNPNSPADILIMLAKDEDSDVRRPVADNPNTPADILIMLAKDEYSYVRWSVARNPKTPADILIMLAKDEDSGVRSSVAGNPNSPADILIMLLAKDEYRGVRWSAAGNPKTPADILKKLTNDHDPEVRKKAFSNLKKRGVKPYATE